MNTQKKYSPNVRERAVRLLLEHKREHPSQWTAMDSIAGKIGCTTEALRKLVREAERDQGKRAGLSRSDDQTSSQDYRSVSVSPSVYRARST